MDNYYKGKLLYTNNLQNIMLNINICNDILLSSDQIFIEYIKKIFKYLDDSEKNLLYNYVKKHNNIDEAMKLLKKYIHNIQFDIPSVSEIIFDLIKDEEGNYYGKEILTGRIFPIMKKSIDFTKYESSNKIFYLSISSSSILTTFNKSQRYEGIIQYESPLIDQEGNIYQVKIDINHLVACSKKKKIIVKRNIGYSDIIGLTINPQASNLYRGNVYIDYIDKIKPMELLNYYNEYKYSNKSKKFNKLINQLAEENIYYQKIMKLSYPNDLLLKIYNNSISNIEFDKYIKTMCDNMLISLKTWKCASELSINDVDRIVEICDLRKLDYKYYIGFLYLMCTLNTTYDFSNGYISNYSNIIPIIIRRLKTDELISDNTINYLKEQAKVKKLV